MNSVSAEVGTLLVGTLFSLYITILMLRFILALVRADFYNPLSQFTVKATQPVLAPLRSIIPPLGRIDTSAVVLMLALQMAETGLLVYLGGGEAPIVAILLYSIHELLELVIYIYIISIIALAIMSWFAPNPYNPVAKVLFDITEPLMRPLRKILPDLGGIDLSPVLGILILQIALIIVGGLFQV